MFKERTDSSSPGDRLTSHRAPLLPLTGIRFCAALYVVLYHTKLPEALSAAGLRHAGYFAANGYLAVVLFFLLSGFILAYTYKGKIGTRKDKRRFWEARFARIWPLYAASLVFSSMALHTTPSASRSFVTLFMVQAWNPADVNMAGSWNFVCWTLSTEAFFYLVFPFFQQWFERRREAVQISCMVAMMGLSVACSTGRHVFGYPVNGLYAHVPLALVHTPEFLIGVSLGNLYLDRQRRTSREEVRSSWAYLGTGLWTWVFLLLSIVLLSRAPDWVVTWSVVSFAALLFGLATEPSLPRRVLSHPLLLFGGQISYGIYLLQWPCKAEVNRACDLLHASSVSLRSGLYLVFLIGISIAGFYLIEDPARKLLRLFFAREERIN